MTFNIEAYQDLTLDEAPSAYKSPSAIINAISPTASIIHSLKPLYSLKA